jgi:DNA-binding beta-propeller fold protein YncE
MPETGNRVNGPRFLAICFALILSVHLLGGCATPSTSPDGGIVIAGNENKIDLTSGTQKVISNPEPDSISILDFSQYPPKVTTLTNVPNTVIGPPSNIAISPDGTLALVANSIKVDPASATGWSPESYVHLIDLTSSPPKVIGRVTADLEPSGISFTPNGRLALVANRAAGTVSVLAVDHMKVSLSQNVKVCEPAEACSDVAISPDGKLAIATVQKAGVLALLQIDGAGKVTAMPRRISVYGQPYRVVITPDGLLALSAGAGFGNALDRDAVSVVDLKFGPQPRTIDYVPIGSTPESMELSPDGKLAAVVVMEGSNLGTDNPFHSSAGAVELLERKGKTFVARQHIPIGRIPEGVAFTSDGRYLLVECHPDRKIWMFRVTSNGTLEDTGRRIEMPGFPSSIRASRN